MYSVEYQIRGLPHTHILNWSFDKIIPREVDYILADTFKIQQSNPELLFSIDALRRLYTV